MGGRYHQKYTSFKWFKQNRVNLGCVFSGKSENGSLIQDHLEHGASKEPKDPFGKGSCGSFDAPWSKWSWINDPFSDFPEKKHSHSLFHDSSHFANNTGSQNTNSSAFFVRLNKQFRQIINRMVTFVKKKKHETLTQSSEIVDSLSFLRQISHCLVMKMIQANAKWDSSRCLNSTL